MAIHHSDARADKATLRVIGLPKPDMSGRLFRANGIMAGIVGWARLSALACFVAANSTAATAEGAAPAVTVVAAVSGELAQTVRVVGTIVARDEVLVHADLDSDNGAKIVEILAEVGDRIRSGQLLARLDSSRIEIELRQSDARFARAEVAIRQATSQVEDARTVERQARSNHDRSTRLKAKGAVSNQSVEDSETALIRAVSAVELAEQGLELAKADWQLAEAERQNVRLRLDQTRIIAPSDGVVIRRPAQLGAIASSSTGPLFALARDGEVELNGEIAQREFSLVQTNAAAQVEFLDGRPPVDGSVRLKSAELTAGNRLGQIRISLFEHPDIAIGAFARANVIVRQRHGVIVPDASVVGADGSYRVQVIADGKVRAREVTVALRTDGLVQLSSGLASGEAVVLKGDNFLKEGDAVTPVKAAFRAPAELQSAETVSSVARQ
ncbi:efflux RND transporter periplasmic adaptor subunit [Phyllobacterium sp. 0TCS1.6C]|uniref:efflux RND transporter periplasmic adaptor subunit n=1 Tax=unclassified Phyllobacterium TaxID=2638441 RepID=UPI002264F326|nr:MULTISPECIES: efflux RND transporter periplasmic adaptor subunit [unclassified Phyllobacterium]MCX8280024.1 efflux RND transporter periplasmic adaptor subunit [Phyllobacterium sp. 0TCS1.6C]MCX8296191.1 efflux RND transporter periplasmic adaptor subunit [Phyllobacterium sp. 0TCS1.6A]